jgi:hypothetical protein
MTLRESFVDLQLDGVTPPDIRCNDYILSYPLVSGHLQKISIDHHYEISRLCSGEIGAVTARRMVAISVAILPQGLLAHQTDDIFSGSFSLFHNIFSRNNLQIL